MALTVVNCGKYGIFTAFQSIVGFSKGLGTDGTAMCQGLFDSVFGFCYQFRRCAASGLRFSSCPSPTIPEESA